MALVEGLKQFVDQETPLALAHKVSNPSVNEWYANAGEMSSELKQIKRKEYATRYDLQKVAMKNGLMAYRQFMASAQVMARQSQCIISLMDLDRKHWMPVSKNSKQR